MTTILVNGTWPLVFQEDKEQHTKQSFLYWLQEHPAHIAGHAAAEYRMYMEVKHHLGNVDSAVEYFGGIGVGTMLIQHLLKPKDHTVYELDMACVTHLEGQKWPGDVSVVYGDSSEAMGKVYGQMVACDFGQFTASQLEKWSEPLDRMFAREPDAVCITDTSITRFWPNRKRYENILGDTFADPPGYYLAMGRHVKKRWGYNLRLAMFRYGFAGYMLFYKEHGHETLIEKAPQVDQLTVL